MAFRPCWLEDYGWYKLNGEYVHVDDWAKKQRPYYVVIEKDPDTCEKEKARRLAVDAMHYANKCQYKFAAELLDEAIGIDGKEPRYFGNRSFCWEKLKQYDKAIDSANEAIRLAPDWLKGYFRKAKALVGQRRYEEAETVFMKAAEIDPNCKEVTEELFNVRLAHIMFYSYSIEDATFALRKCGNVKSAFAYLMNPTTELFFPRGDLGFAAWAASRQKKNAREFNLKNSSKKTDPANPEGVSSLWVGNLNKEVNVCMLARLFQKHGNVLDVRLMSDKRCAFINFVDAFGASNALKCLQGYELYGQNILVKYPDNPLQYRRQLETRYKGPESLTNPCIIPSKKYSNDSIDENAPDPGPWVRTDNGKECYNFRTTGCGYGPACRYKHIEAHRGIDTRPKRHPWSHPNFI